MPNPGFVRYSVAIVAALSFLYSVVLGEEMPADQQQAWTDALGNGYVAMALIYSMGAALYSKLFPSTTA